MPKTTYTSKSRAKTTSKKRNRVTKKTNFSSILNTLGQKKYLVVIALIAIVGVIVTIKSFAGGAIYNEPESWSINNTKGVASRNDASASGGRYIEFIKDNPTSEPGTGRFTVQDGKIFAPSGKQFVPIGGNVVPYIKYDCYILYCNNLSATGHVNDAKSWGWNMVRLNFFAHPGPGVTYEDTLNGITKLIDEYTAAGIVVMPSSHDLTGNNAPLTDAKYGEINKLWDDLLVKYKDNPYVWVNYTNEPIDGFAQVLPLWRQLGDQLYQRVRQRAPNSIFVYDMPIYGQAISEMAEENYGTDFLQGKDNVILSWHNYGGSRKNINTWESGDYNDMTNWAQTLKDKKIPTIIGEFGRSYEANTPNQPWIDVAADWTFDKFWEMGFGGLWWHTGGRGDDNYDLRMDRKPWYYEASALTASGQRLKNLPTQKPTQFE